MRVKKLITVLGGPAAIGAYLGIRSQAVSLWVANGRIPLERVPALVRRGKELGLDIRPDEIRKDFDWEAVRK